MKEIHVLYMFRINIHIIPILNIQQIFTKLLYILHEIPVSFTNTKRDIYYNNTDMHLFLSYRYWVLGIFGQSIIEPFQSGLNLLLSVNMQIRTIQFVTILINPITHGLSDER